MAVPSAGIVLGDGENPLDLLPRHGVWFECSNHSACENRSSEVHLGRTLLLASSKACLGESRVFIRLHFDSLSELRAGVPFGPTIEDWLSMITFERTGKRFGNLDAVK